MIKNDQTCRRPVRTAGPGGQAERPDRTAFLRLGETAAASSSIHIDDHDISSPFSLALRISVTFRDRLKRILTDFRHLHKE